MSGKTEVCGEAEAGVVSGATLKDTSAKSAAVQDLTASI